MTTRSTNKSHIFRVYSTHVIIQFTLASQHPCSLRIYHFFFSVMAPNLPLLVKVVLELPPPTDSLPKVSVKIGGAAHGRPWRWKTHVLWVGFESPMWVSALTRISRLNLMSRWNHPGYSSLSLEIHFNLSYSFLRVPHPLFEFCISCVIPSECRTIVWRKPRPIHPHSVKLIWKWILRY